MKRRFLSAMASAMPMVFALAFFGCGSTGTIEMVRIPAGTFTMGDNDTQSWGAQPPHTVTLTQGFYMSRHEITQGQFESVMGFNPSHFTAEVVGHDTTNFPVENVSWYHAVVFSNRLSIREGLSPAYEMETMTPSVWSTDPDDWGAIPTSSNARWNNVRIVADSNGYRLPTEAQWEFAARAGTTTPWNTGESIMPTQANFLRNATVPVGSFPPNAWGLYDMYGNVSEWVWDWFGSYSAAPQIDPTGASSGLQRALRGGNWLSGAQSLRSAYRSVDAPATWILTLGFRVVRP